MNKTLLVAIFIVEVIVFGILFFNTNYFHNLLCQISGSSEILTCEPEPFKLKEFNPIYYEKGIISVTPKPITDSGRFCYENSECEVECLWDGQFDQEGYLTGSCGRYSIVNCRPSIPEKTKNTKATKGGSCV